MPVRQFEQTNKREFIRKKKFIRKIDACHAEVGLNSMEKWKLKQNTAQVTGSLHSRKRVKSLNE